MWAGYFLSDYAFLIKAKVLGQYISEACINKFLLSISQWVLRYKTTYQYISALIDVL